MKFENATPVLRCGDYGRAKAFYIDTLGFRCIEEGGEPAGFGIFVRDRAQIFLESWQGPDAPYHRWRAYIHIDDHDALVSELRDKVAFTGGPHTTEYGMREVEITDPDGNVLCFGSDA